MAHILLSDPLGFAVLGWLQKRKHLSTGRNQTTSSTNTPHCTSPPHSSFLLRKSVPDLRHFSAFPHSPEKQIALHRVAFIYLSCLLVYSFTRILFSLLFSVYHSATSNTYTPPSLSSNPTELIFSMASIRDLMNDQDQEMEPPSHHTFATTHPESAPSSHSHSRGHSHNHSHSHHHHSQHNHHFQPYPSHHHGSNSHHSQEPHHQPPMHYPPHPQPQQGYPREYYNHAPPPHAGAQYYQPPYSREAPPRAFDPVKAEIAQHQQLQPQFHQQPYPHHQRQESPQLPPDEPR